MTEREVQSVLFSNFGMSSMLMIPNFTPAHWWECDLYRITARGYSEEFEIKTSVADFRADGKKAQDFRLDGVWTQLRKHDLLTSKDLRGPSRFWFAVPEEIAPKIQIPEWAGLVEIRGSYLHQTKIAPRLHMEKASPAVINAARNAFYYRYWNLRRGSKEEAAP